MQLKILSAQKQIKHHQNYNIPEYLNILLIINS